MESVKNVRLTPVYFKGLGGAAGKAGKAAGKVADEAAKKAKDLNVKRAQIYIGKETSKKINKELGWLGKLNRFLDLHDGEIQNQLINATFTCTLAPLMIWKNPFSKKSEKDKAYCAVRQPISAAIAVTGGAAATHYLEKLWNKLANDGFIANHDLRMNPNDSYLKANFNEELKQAKAAGGDRLKEFIKMNKPEELDKPIEDIVKLIGDKKVQKDLLGGYSERIKNLRSELFSTLLSSDRKDITIDNGKIFLKGKELTKETGILPNLTTKENLDAFLNKNNMKNTLINLKNAVENAGENTSKILKGALQTLGQYNKDIMGDDVELMKNKFNKIMKECFNGDEVNPPAIKKYSKGMIKNVATDFKNFKGIVNPIINIPIAVVTCTVLNWVYPRFVEWFMPSLIRPDKPVQTANQKQGGVA